MNKLKVVLFYAFWDVNNKEKKDLFCEECRRLKLHYECRDVEDYVDQTTQLGIRNVPAIVIYSGKSVIGIEKGNDAYKNIEKYL